MLLRYMLLVNILLLTACIESDRSSQTAIVPALQVPIGSPDQIIARLAPHLIVKPKTLVEEEINFLLDHAMEHNWDVHFHEPGILYNVVVEGDGSSPVWGDYISVHYEGRNLAGKIFDSSRSRGQAMQFYVGNVIDGWNEILQNLLRTGGRGLFIIPAHLAYGNEGFGKFVAPEEHLIFDLELLEILPAPN